MKDATQRGIDQIVETEKKHWPGYQKIVDDHNEQLKKDLVPMYRQMVEVFTTRGHQDRAAL